jgi:hypothetical protein
MKERRHNLTGQRFGNLTVLEFSHKNSSGNCYWKCLCDCGKESLKVGTRLSTGHTTSCGCQGLLNQKLLVTKHGFYNTRTYHTWEGMIQRCTNPNATRYPDYGGRGVTVCDRWLTFTNFLEDMGERPENKTLDRIDPFGNYEPWNCRWATRKEQQNNQRRHKMTEEVKNAGTG